MDTAQPPLVSAPVSPVAPVSALRRRHTVTLRLLFIAALVVLLQIPLGLINNLRQERSGNRETGESRCSRCARATLSATFRRCGGRRDAP